MVSRELIPVRLHGELGRRFGHEYNLAVKTPQEAARCLCQLKGFEQAIRDKYLIVQDGGKPIGAEEVTFYTRGSIDFIPVVEGAASDNQKQKSMVTIVLGAVLLGAAVVATGGLGAAFAAGASGTLAGTLAAGAANLGVGLILAGAAGLLSPTPKLEDYSSRDRQEQSFLFSGPLNRVAQGGPVPLAYGRVRVGSTLVSGGTMNSGVYSLSARRLDVTGTAIGAYLFSYTGGGDFDNNLLHEISITNTATVNSRWRWETQVTWNATGSTPREEFAQWSARLWSDSGKSKTQDAKDYFRDVASGTRSLTYSWEMIMEPGEQWRHWVRSHGAGPTSYYSRLLRLT